MIAALQFPPTWDRAAPASRPIALVLALLAGACGSEDAAHPWLDLEDGPPHQIVEVSGLSGSQLVIVVEPDASPDEVMELGRRIQDQAPPGTAVNARIFNDEGTARSWRTAPGQWTREHLLAVVTIVPETGLNEVRWVRPEAPLPGSQPDGGAGLEGDPVRADTLLPPPE